MSTTADLIAFIRARLDEDEELATAAIGDWRCDDSGGITDLLSYAAPLAADLYGRPMDPASREHVLRHQPSRALRQITAMRLLLDLAEDADCVGDHYAAGRILAALVPVWSDHPDYDKAWAV